MTKRAYSDSDYAVLVATYEYRNNFSNRFESKTSVSPDSDGMIYYRYMDEDRYGIGYGRIDRSRRQTALNGELSYKYEYYASPNERWRQRKMAYSDDNYYMQVATYYYFYNVDNRVEVKTLASPDPDGMIYYKYMDENWNGTGIGRVNSSRRQTAFNRELSYTYDYYAVSGRLMTIRAYSDLYWTNLVATYDYEDMEQGMGDPDVLQRVATISEAQAQRQASGAAIVGEMAGKSDYKSLQLK